MIMPERLGVRDTAIGELMWEEEGGESKYKKVVWRGSIEKARLLWVVVTPTI